MLVIAQPVAGGTPVELGSVADAIWVDGFKYSQTRTIQKSLPINATAPNLYDRLMRMEDFAFAAGRSFGSPGAALLFFGSHPSLVPALANLQFTQSSQNVWLRNCGIEKVELVKKGGALVIFSYHIIGGTWSPN